MSIFEKIRAWWTARREAKRDWWLEPIDETIKGVALGLAASLGEHEKRVVKRLDEQEDLILKLRDSIFNTVNLAKDDNRITSEELGNKLNAQMEAIRVELNGIRSRYHWVEERYEDMTKGAVPREFNFDKRQ